MIKINVDELLNFEKKQLFERITRYIGKKIDDADNILGIEFEKHLGIPGARISEWKNFDKYKQTISKRHLNILFDNEVVTLDEIVKECVEDMKEFEYLKSL